MYVDDLTVEAQDILLERFQTLRKNENWDVFPIAIIERELDEIEVL